MRDNNVSNVIFFLNQSEESEIDFLLVNAMRYNGKCKRTQGSGPLTFPSDIDTLLELFLYYFYRIIFFRKFWQTYRQQ